MVSYEATLHLEDLSLANAVDAYMREKHVGEVFATGCFVDTHFEQSAPDTYRSRYSAKTQEDLDRYLAEHAPRLRADFLEHFPTGVRITRAIWTERASYV